MVFNKTLLLVILGTTLLINVVIAPAPPTICSTFCGTNGCTTSDMYDCNGKCYTTTGWGWNSVDGVCDFSANPTRQIMAYSGDDGGDIDISAGTGSLSCTAYGISYYGDFTAGSTVNATLAIGTYLPHYAFDVYLSIALVDVTGTHKWQGSPKMFASLLGSTQAPLSTSMQVSSGGTGSQTAGSGVVIVSTQDGCGVTNKQDNYERLIFQSFTHNTTGDSITVSFTSDNSDSVAIWDAREFIFVAKLCNIYCLSCFGSNINQCTSCDATVGYMLSGTTCATSCLSGYGMTADPSLCVLCDVQCIVCYDLSDNCTSCKTSGGNAAYLYDNTTAGYFQCVNPCPTGYFANTTSRAC